MCASPAFVPVPAAAMRVPQAAEDGELSCCVCVCVCEYEWVMIAGWSLFPALLGVLSDKLFWFGLQNEVGFVN